METTNPEDGAGVDLGAERELALEGTVEAGSAVETVLIEADGELDRSAALAYEDGRLAWRFEGAAPGGRHTLRAVATDRAGKNSSAEVSVDLAEPDAGDAVLAPLTVVVPIGSPSGDPFSQRVPAVSS
ncbi:MAG: hypothetical protein LBO20_02320 [Bifidobacteriaceae bacterium]|nr:hypothetical protein [Bifidobacteriaceae bacterium]